MSVHQAETLRAVAFMVFAGFIFVWAAGRAARLGLRRLRRDPKPAGGWTSPLDRYSFALAGVGLLCILYGRFVEPYRLTVTVVPIHNQKLARVERPIRLVHLSDIHSDPAVRLEERLPEAIAALKPDLIVFSGDAINSPEGLPVFKRCMTRLAAIAPTYAVRGNWDVWYWGDLDLYGGTGVMELDGLSEVEIAGTRLQLAGVPVEREAAIDGLLESASPERYTIFVHHYPDEIHTVARLGADLYCAGHTHGGQVALPFYGALVTLSKLGKAFEAGLYQVGRTSLYVSRGIGMEGGSAPRVRFWAPPEIVLIELGA